MCRKENLNKLQKIRKDIVSIIKNVKGYVKNFSQKDLIIKYPIFE